MTRLRDAKVARAFKDACAARGDDCCEFCRWRPPRALRDRAGGRIDRLLHGHHVVPVSCGGADAAANLILLCPTHHALAHHIGTIVPGAVAGTYEWIGPATRADLLLAFRLMVRAEDYGFLVDACGFDAAAFLEARHGEALVLKPAIDRDFEIRTNRLFTVSRGLPLNAPGTRRMRRGTTRGTTGAESVSSPDRSTHATSEESAENINLPEGAR